MLIEIARAKINLSLAVLGRRPDGFHELDSLVAFAGVGDRLTFKPSPIFSLDCDGPFKLALDGENLVAKAAVRASAAAPGLTTGRFQLTKLLPVAAGLGGGSADAAATLRLLQRANLEAAPAIDWQSLARSLGADVPVCLASRAAIMTGIGERVTLLDRFPLLHILLVNPGIPLRTADVFSALAASPLTAAPPIGPQPVLRDFADLIGHLAHRPNHLEPVAKALCPAVGTVLERLAALPGARLARMSGSGPTCFAVFKTDAEAHAAASQLSTAEPHWWIQPSTLS